VEWLKNYWEREGAAEKGERRLMDRCKKGRREKTCEK